MALSAELPLPLSLTQCTVVVKYSPDSCQRTKTNEHQHLYKTGHSVIKTCKDPTTQTQIMMF